MKTQALTAFAVAILGVAFAATQVAAKVPASQAARLGKDLTFIGAEKAGSKSGIPAWTGRKIDGSKMLVNYDGGPLPDLYPSDKPLYTITPSNMGKYGKQLTPGHKAMLETYPKSYFLNVYKSRRSCRYPDFVYDASVRNAKVGDLVDGGNGISEAIMSSPFPIPNNGLEIIWNHTLRYRGRRIARDFNYAVPTASGDYTLTFTRDEVLFPYSDPKNQRAEDLNNISIYFVAYTSAPAIRAGGLVLVHETLNMAKEGRKAWSYNRGLGRITRVSNIAYDNPITNGDGMGTSDQYDGYNGAPDRYDWTVLGKEEKLSQQNNYRAVLGNYEELLKPGHTNPSVHRYELRRQWVVEGVVDEARARHLYLRRVLRLDEDSWQITGGELYDGRSEIWRVQEVGQAPDYRPHAQLCFTTGGEFIYDRRARRYMGLAMKSNRPANLVEEGLEYLQPKYYTSANASKLGR